MKEILTPTDKQRQLGVIENANSTLNRILAEHKIPKNFYHTESGLSFLRRLGLRKETLTLVRSAAVLSDIAFYTDNPSESLVGNRIVPTIADVISQVVQEASRKKVDMKTEINVALIYLKGIYTSNEQSKLKVPLTSDYIDKHLDPAIRALNEARQIV